MSRSRQRQHRREHVESEAAWFYVELQGRAENAPESMRARARDLQTAVLTLSAFHRGALSLWYRDKPWPEVLRRKFGRSTSLVVRLACAATPSVGATEPLEAAAMERLLVWMAGRGSDADDDALGDLEVRAEMYFRRAIRALTKALPSVSPAKAAARAVVAGDALESA
jgi:hypothetical protein